MLAPSSTSIMPAGMASVAVAAGAEVGAAVGTAVAVAAGLQAARMRPPAMIRLNRLNGKERIFFMVTILLKHRGRIYPMQCAL